MPLRVLYSGLRHRGSSSIRRPSRRQYKDRKSNRSCPIIPLLRHHIKCREWTGSAPGLEEKRGWQGPYEEGRCPYRAWGGTCPR